MDLDFCDEEEEEQELRILVVGLPDWAKLILGGSVK